MTLLENRPNAALVVDVQNGNVDGAHERDTVVGNIAALVERARREGVAVVWVQHINDELPVGTEAWEIVPELSPAEGEPLIEKRYGDTFEDTSFEAELARLGVGRLVVTGAATNACIRSTLHGAVARGYDATLVTDAHTTVDQTQWGMPAPEAVITYENLFWTYALAPGRTLGAAPAAEVELGTRT